MSKLQVDDIVNKDDTGGVGFSKGVVVTGITTSTSFDGDLTGNVTGNADTATYAPTAGIATNAQGLTGTPNLNVGIVTATEFSGDGSNLDNIKSGITTFIASGTISNGNTVVINTDGTVSAVSGSGSVNPSAGISTVFEESESSNLSATFDSSNNRIIIAYTDVTDNSYGKVVVGTVVGTGITFGTPVIFEQANTSNISVAYDSSTNKVVVAYKDNGNSSHGTAIVGTVSGNDIDFSNSTAVVFEAANSSYMSAVYDSTNQKVVIAYSDGPASNGKAIVGAVSGNTIDFSSSQANPVVFEPGITASISAVYDSGDDKVVIAYSDQSNSGNGTAVVGTVSGITTSITFGDPVVYEEAQIQYTSAVYDSGNDKVVIAYQDTGNNNYATAVVGNVSGDTINFGAPVVVNSTDSDSVSAAYDSNYSRVVFSYRDQSDSGAGKAVVGSVSGTTLNPGSAFEFDSNVQHVSSIYDSTNQKVVIAYQDDQNSNYGTAKVFSSVSLTTNLTEENYIGIAAEAIADGATGKINIVGGINASQTGLTTAQKYYANPLGGLSVDPIIAAGGNTTGIPIIIAGTSISDTSIIVNGEDDSSTSSGSGSGDSGTYGDNNVDAHLNRDGTVGVSSVLGWNGNDYNWQSPGAWNLISTITASGASTVDFTSGIDSTYRRYVILGSEIQSTVGNTFLYMRVYENGSLYQAGNYHWGNAYYADYAVGAAYDVVNLNQGVNSNYLSLSNQNGGLQYPSTLELVIDNPSASKTHYKINSKLECGPSNNQTIVWSSGSIISSSALTNVNGIQLYPNSQTINGTFKLYGIK